MADKEKKTSIPTPSSSFFDTIIPILIGAGLLAVLVGGIFGCAANIFPGGNSCSEGAGVLMLRIAGLFLWIGGVFLDFVIENLILQMGAYVGYTGGFEVLVTGIEKAWGLIRDIVNIAIIGALVWTSLAIIFRLQQGTYGKTIVKILIAALLVNFSYLFAATIIDASNFVSVKIFEETFVIEGCTEPGGFFACNGSVSGSFMELMKISSINSIDDFEAISDNSTGGDGTQLLWVGLFGSILFLITAYVFLAAAIMLIIRFCILVLLLILSPIGIAGMILDQTKEYSKQWWSAMTSNAIFPPAYFVMTAISLSIVGSIGPAIATQSATTASAGTSSFGKLLGGASATLDILTAFVIAVFFMLASLIVAKKAGAIGVTVAQGVAGRLTFGALGGGFRTFVGGPARALTGGATRFNWAGTTPGKALVDTGRSLAKSSFDLRNIPGIKGTAKDALGEGTTEGGYEQRMKKREEKNLEYGGYLLGEQKRREAEREKEPGGAGGRGPGSGGAEPPEEAAEKAPEGGAPMAAPKTYPGSDEGARPATPRGVYSDAEGGRQQLEELRRIREKLVEDMNRERRFEKDAKKREKELNKDVESLNKKLTANTAAIDRQVERGDASAAEALRNEGEGIKASIREKEDERDKAREKREKARSNMNRLDNQIQENTGSQKKLRSSDEEVGSPAERYAKTLSSPKILKFPYVNLDPANKNAARKLKEEIKSGKSREEKLFEELTKYMKKSGEESGGGDKK